MATEPTLGNVIAPDPAWVAKVSEPALEPELPAVELVPALMPLPPSCW